MKLVNHLDLDGFQIKNGGFETLNEAPENPFVGQVYLDTTDSKTKIWNGEFWDILQQGDQGFTAWREETEVVTVNGRTVEVLARYVDGTGTIPTANIGKFRGEGGWVDNAEDAINFINEVADAALNKKADKSTINSPVNVVYGDADLVGNQYINELFKNQTVTVFYKNPPTDNADKRVTLTFNNDGVLTLPFTPAEDFDATIVGTTGAILYRGWTRIVSPIEYGDGPDYKVINQIKGYKHGEGEPPTEYIGFYLDPEGEAVEDPLFALDIRGPQGAGGGGGGGGSGTGVAFRVQSISSLALNFIRTGDATIVFNFTSTENGESTGNGTLIVTIGAKTVISKSVPQGLNSINIKEFLTAGTSVVKFKVSDSYGNSRTMDYAINLIDLSISSSYDITTVNTGEITFRYTPIGTTIKTIHFILDDVELPSVTTTINNIQMTKTIPALSHGTHKLEVYITVNFSGSETRSNTLFYDLVCTEVGNTSTIISIVYPNTIEQYTTARIPYFIFNPLNINSEAVLKADGLVQSTVTVNRSLKYWNYRPNEVGEVSLSIESNGVVKDGSVMISPTTINVQSEEQDLTLFLTSQNRSNNELNRSQWKHGAVEATLTGFNWITNGWITDSNGSTSLRISDGARVVIPVKPFQTNPVPSGKTIEFEFKTSELVNYEANLISCKFGNIGFTIDANIVKLQSEQSEVSTRFKEDERVRIALVISKLTNNRIIYVYVNGIISALKQYPALDNWVQSTAQDITIGSDEANISLYNIRIYNNNLNNKQLLDNYIADLDDTEKKIAIYNRNDIFDGFGIINQDKTLQFIPSMLMTGRLPAYKGDKVDCNLEYTNPFDTTKSFTAKGRTDVQGTSSQYYPRKNYKIKFSNIVQPDGPKAKYILTDGAIPESTFTFKADFAESSGTHNTGLSRLIDYLLRTLSIKTPPMVGNNNVRTTIDGFPMLIFHRETVGGLVTFLGKYNFNHDKSNEATFGFSAGAECWEVLNNTSDNVLFKAADFTTEDEEGNFVWESDFEARYPEDSKNTTNLSNFCTWVVSTIGNPTKFKTEAPTYMNVEMMLFYYCITELFAMVDQRAKNMMMAFWDSKMYPIFYDSDTTLGVDNVGDISFSYDVEYHDVVGSGFAWNAESSTLFNNLEQAYPAEIADMYNRIRTSLSYNKAMDFFNKDQSDKWGEAIFNEDARFKYLLPLLEDNGDYLYAAQGSRSEYRKWWLFNRFRYMDSKYKAQSFLTDFATMRLYTPVSAPALAPNADFMLNALTNGYARVKYGSYIVNTKLKKNEIKLVKAPEIQFNDTETIVYGMSFIKGLGALANKYAGTLDVSKAKFIIELNVGSSNVGYNNANLNGLNIGNNKLLKSVDVTNCSNLIQPLDVSGCPAIKEVKAKGSGITTVILPDGGVLELLHLPKPTSLVIKNQILLTNTGLEIVDKQALKTLIIENCPLLNIGTLLPTLTRLERVRLVNIAGQSDFSLDFYTLYSTKGIDDNGNPTDNAVIQGTWHFENAFAEDLVELATRYPFLTVTYDNLITEIPFQSAAIEAALVAKFGPMTISNVRSITDMDGVFEGVIIEDNTSFDEFKYFTGITEIGEFDFPLKTSLTLLTSTTFPSSLKTINDNAYINAKTVLGLQHIEELNRLSFGYSSGSQFCFADMDIVNFSNVKRLMDDAGYNTIISQCFDIKHLDFTGSTFDIVQTNNFKTVQAQKITLPNTVKRIEDYGLYNNSQLINTDLPNSIEYLGSLFMSGFTVLNPSNRLTLPVNLKEVASQGLAYLNYQAYIFSEDIETLGFTIGNIQLIEVEFKGLIPPTIQANSLQIDNSEFLTQIYVPDAALNDYKTATNWTVYASRNQIHPVSEKPSVITPVSNLITFQSTTIKDALEAEFGTMTKIKASQITNMNGCFEGVSVPTEDSFDEFQYFTSLINIETYDLPYIFGGAEPYKGISSITFPPSLRSIGNYVQLSARTVIGTNQLTHVGSFAFGSDGAVNYVFSNMLEVKFENLTSIGTAPSYGSIIIGGLIKHLDFTGSTFDIIPDNGLKSITCLQLTLPNTVKRIEREGLNNITAHVILPNTVEYMGRLCYTVQISLLNTITLPTSLLYLETKALERVYVPEIIIPQSINYISDSQISLENQAFIMQSVSPPGIHIYAFDGTYRASAIYVPDASVADYKAATNWSSYEDIIFPISSKP